MAIDRSDATAGQDAGDVRRSSGAFEDPEVLARAQAAVDAFTRGGFPTDEGVGPEQLPEFLREQG